MEVSIGVQNVAREITLESDMTPEAVREAITHGVATGTLVVLTDSKGKQVLVPGSAIGWVVIGESEKTQVGFGAS